MLVFIVELANADSHLPSASNRKLTTCYNSQQLWPQGQRKLATPTAGFEFYGKAKNKLSKKVGNKHYEMNCSFLKTI